MKLKMLVADDHRLFVQGIKSMLNSELGLEISDFAANGKEAIDKCVKGDFELVLMDINMPVIDGIEATREIKRLNPATKVLIVSMLGDLSSVVKALKAGANGYVLKDTDPAELLKALKTVTRGEVYICDALAEIYKQDSPDREITSEKYIRFTESLISPREQQILKLIVEGYTDPQIAETLFLSDKTVSTHRKNMLAKLGVHNTAALVKFAIENKLIS